MSATHAEKTVIPLNETHGEGHDSPSKNTDMTQRLANVQDLLFGDAQRELVDRLDHSDDRQREFAESTAAQIQALTDALDTKIETLRQEIRSIDRAQTAKRRKLVGDLGDAIKAMAYDA